MQASGVEGGSDGLRQFGRLKADAVNSLRYRGQDVLRGLTKRAVQEARSRDLKLEVLNCTRLQVMCSRQGAVRAHAVHACWLWRGECVGPQLAVPIGVF